MWVGLVVGGAGGGWVGVGAGFLAGDGFLGWGEGSLFGGVCLVELWWLWCGGRIGLGRGGRRKRASPEGMDSPVMVQLRDMLVVAFCFCLFSYFYFLIII